MLSGAFSAVFDLQQIVVAVRNYLSCLSSLPFGHLFSASEIAGRKYTCTHLFCDALK
jgi:hypothetical protein